MLYKNSRFHFVRENQPGGQVQSTTTGSDWLNVPYGCRGYFAKSFHTSSFIAQDKAPHPKYFGRLYSVTLRSMKEFKSHQNATDKKFSHTSKRGLVIQREFCVLQDLSSSSLLMTHSLCVDSTYLRVIFVFLPSVVGID